MSAIRLAARQIIFGPITALTADRQRLVEVPVIRGPARGLRFKLDLLKGGESAYWLGRYDSAILRMLAGICKRGSIAWDVGSHIGFYSAFLARLVGPAGCVVAFEPHPDNFQRTTANIALNRFSNVSVLNVALGAPVGELDFVLSGNTTSHVEGAYVGSKAKPSTVIQQRISVRCVSPDQALLEYHIQPPHLIKIDIEGAERDALQYFSRLAESVRPVILLELHNPECDVEAWKFAQRFGYAITATATGRLLHTATDVAGTVLLSPESIT